MAAATSIFENKSSRRKGSCRDRNIQKMSNGPTFNKSQPRRGPNVQRLAAALAAFPVASQNKTAHRARGSWLPQPPGPSWHVPGYQREHLNRKRLLKTYGCHVVVTTTNVTFLDFQPRIWISGFRLHELNFGEGRHSCLTSCCCSYPAVTSASE